MRIFNSIEGNSETGMFTTDFRRDNPADLIFLVQIDNITLVICAKCQKFILNRRYMLALLIHNPFWTWRMIKDNNITFQIWSQSVNPIQMDERSSWKLKLYGMISGRFFRRRKYNKKNSLLYVWLVHSVILILQCKGYAIDRWLKRYGFSVPNEIKTYRWATF